MPVDFEKRFREYLDNISEAKSESSKTYLFLNFISDVFKGVKASHAEKLIPKLEKHIKVKQGTVVVAGRVDVFLGNLIIEFKSDLANKLEEAKTQLRDYISILWSGKKHRIEWLALASDGLNFRVYRPRTSVLLGKKVWSKDVFLEEIDKCNLDVMYQKQGSDWVYVWLDRYLLYRTLIPPTTEEFVKDFGLASSSFKISNGLLKSAWNKIQGTGVEAIYDEWSKYLEIVYGSKVESEDLFIRHTYLATLAKLMAFMFYSGAVLPSPQEVENIISGDIFSEWGIYGFLEEDFFSWILKEGIKEKGLKFVMDLLGRLKRYDLTQLEEDVLKGLYQELVDPKERHDLGEYYTPDWLAESIVQDILKSTLNASVLDPACGSGTFLVATINFKKRHLEGKESPQKLLNHVLNDVVGIDVHPLAVITSKVNYLLALGDLIRKYRRGRITIPVYMGDSIRLPQKVETLEEKVVAYVVKGPKKKQFFIPKIVAENAEAHDEVIQGIRDYVRRTKKLDRKTFRTFIELRAQNFTRILKKKPKIRKAIYNSLFKTARSMWDLQRDGKDTIWAFILRNLFKPLFFFVRRKKFDVITGNPPWLSFRYVKNIEYQKDLKKLIIDTYQLLPSDKAELMTHMELATLFFLRTTDLYLKRNGQIGFVMPRSVFPADQHDNFRRGAFIHSDLGFMKIYDLLNVRPLFNVPSSVFFARKGKKVKYPINATVFSGKLPKKNCKLEEVEKHISRRKTKLKLGTLGKRTFITERVLKISKIKSDYYKRVYQGATIVPRQFWFVELISHPKFGINQRTPFIQTSERAKVRAKEPYKDVSFEGNVESRFLFGALTGSELVPFGCLKPVVIVSPIERKGNGYRLIDSEESRLKGLNLEKWLRKAEKVWTKKRGEKAKKMTIYERLDRQKGLTRQNARAKFKVVYNTSGTYLVSAVVENRKPSVTINGIRIRLQGIVIDTKLYCYETSHEDEAYYLSAILNSNVIDNAIKPAQSRGLFGPRDIHKKPFEIAIPKFNSRNAVHKKLSRLGMTCTTKVKKLLPDLTEEYDSIGWIRKKINESLKLYIDEIDDLVLKMFETYENKGTLKAFIG